MLSPAAVRLMLPLLGLAVFPLHARADIYYASERTTYYVAPGGNVTVQISIVLTGADIAPFLDDNGLYSAGVSLSIVSSLPMNTPAIIPSPAAIAPNLAAFDDSFGPIISSSTTPNAGLLMLTDPFDSDGDLGVLGSPIGQTQVIALATVTFTAGLNLGESTVVLIDDYDAGLSDTVTWETFQVLDAQLAPARFAIVVSANPACPADLDMSGEVTSQDFFNFLTAYFAGEADFNGLDGTDSQDFFDFLTAFFTGC